ncbi:MAG: hypothetical protein NUV54_00195 [Candidatus Taylorbacteria bacterium]|nr:hypothetical protein [Candidatus Taylorbacteria bacterium]
MKEIFEKNKKALLFLGIFVLLGAVYFLFFTDSSSSSGAIVYDPTAGGLVSEVSVSPSDIIVGHELLIMLSRLHSISLDASIFTSPEFLGLKDKNRPIDPQPLGKALGRRNPFAEFGSSRVAVPTPVATSTNN